MRYRVIEATSVEDLEAQVGEACADGWRPQGGVAVGVWSEVIGRSRTGNVTSEFAQWFQALVHDES